MQFPKFKRVNVSKNKSEQEINFLITQDRETMRNILSLRKRSLLHYLRKPSLLHITTSPWSRDVV